jgi:tRNA 2-thiouridine synthesizing protein A
VSEVELNVRGLLCPMPVIRAQNKIAELAPGDTLRIVATDPGALHDIPTWCRVHGHTVIDARKDESEIVIRVRVENPDA